MLYIVGLLLAVFGGACVWAGGRLLVVGAVIIALGALVCYAEYTELPRINHDNICGIPLVVTKIEHYQTIVNNERTLSTWLIFCQTSFRKGYATQYGFTSDSASASGVVIGDSARVYNIRHSMRDEKHPMHVVIRGRIVSTDLMTYDKIRGST